MMPVERVVVSFEETIKMKIITRMMLLLYKVQTRNRW